MAELFTVGQLLAPSAMAIAFDRSRGRALARASSLAGLAVAAPALVDAARAQLGAATMDHAALLPLAWGAQAAAVGLGLTLPTLVRVARDARERALVARLVAERARLAAEWEEG